MITKSTSKLINVLNEDSHPNHFFCVLSVARNRGSKIISRITHRFHHDPISQFVLLFIICFFLLISISSIRFGFVNSVEDFDSYGILGFCFLVVWGNNCIIARVLFLCISTEDFKGYGENNSKLKLDVVVVVAFLYCPCFCSYAFQSFGLHLNLCAYEFQLETMKFLLMLSFWYDRIGKLKRKSLSEV